jgi:glucose/arabinose dehydrogenase
MQKQERLAWALCWTLAAGLLPAACGDDSSKPSGGDGDETPADGEPKPGTVKPDASGGATRDAGAAPPKDVSASDAGQTQPEPDGSDSGSTMQPPVQTECDPSVAPDVGKLALEAVPGLEGLRQLVYAAQAPGSSDWYFLEQGGTLRVLSGGTLSAPWIDLTSEISVPAAGGLADEERGLLGIAFAPDYDSSGTFYVMKTATSGADASQDTVLQYTRPASGGTTATKVGIILELDSSAFNHNGGTLRFGPDGMLYVGTGDGGGVTCNDSKPGAPQDRASLFGKILRLDLSKPKPYTPADNPFPSDGSGLTWHYGLRNPYRWSFDKLTGDLYIGDVGFNSYEEIDFVAAGQSGKNFGWPAFEGDHPGCRDVLRAGDTATKPIVDIDRRRTAQGPYRDYISIMGGHVYRGSAIPQLQGVYIFGDYKGARLGALRQCGDTTSPVTAIAKARDPNMPNAPAFARVGTTPALTTITSFAVDNAGEIYIVANRNSLLKIVPGQ